MTPEQAVIERILDLTAVTALVGTRVYMLRLPQQSVLPAIRVQVIDEVSGYHLRGVNYPMPSRVQVDVYAGEASGADPYAAAIAVAEAVDGNGLGSSATGLSGWSGPSHGASPLNIHLIQRVDRSVDYDAEERREVRVRQDYIVHWGPARPAVTTPIGASGRGPQPTIAPPVGAIEINPGDDIQAAITANAPGATFALMAGVHQVTGSNVPKSGQTFVGQYGAILDGSTWVESDPTQAVFRAHNQYINSVTISNLTIQNVPQRAVHAFKDFSAGWVIDHCELAYGFTGVQLSDGATISNSKIHHFIGDPNAVSPADRGGAYTGDLVNNILLDNNEFSFNGPEQKILEGSGHIVRNNWYHDTWTGIWFDGDNTNVLIEDNTFEDIDLQAIFYEISEQGTIRRNTVRRAQTGLFISTSKHVTATENVFEDCWRGITLFLNCSAIGGGVISFDLANNLIAYNIIRVGTLSGSYASNFDYEGTCPAPTIVPYANGSKLNLFQNNDYFVQSLGGAEWMWAGVNKTYAQWQAVPQDSLGTMQLR